MYKTVLRPALRTAGWEQGNNKKYTPEKEEYTGRKKNKKWMGNIKRGTLCGAYLVNFRKCIVGQRTTLNSNNHVISS